MHLPQDLVGCDAQMRVEEDTVGLVSLGHEHRGVRPGDAE